MNEPTMSELLCRLQLGAQDAAEAYDLLMRQYWEVMRRGLRHRFSGQLSEEDIEDVAQNVMSRMWFARGTYREAGTPMEWFWTIVRNAALDQLRKAKREPRGISLDDPDQVLRVEAKLATPAPDVARKEKAGIVFECLDQQPPKNRLCVKLRLEGLTFDEIASVMKGEGYDHSADYWVHVYHRTVHAVSKCVVERLARKGVKDGN